MKKLVILVVVLAAVLMGNIGNVFADGKAIDIVRKEGLMNNFRDGSFHENDNVYMAELSVVLWRLYAEDNMIDAPEFLKGVWCSKEFNWARAQFGSFVEPGKKQVHYKDLLTNEMLAKIDRELSLKLGEPQVWFVKTGFVKRGELAEWALKRYIGGKKFIFKGVMPEQELLTAEVNLTSRVLGLKTEVLVDKTTGLKNLLKISRKSGECLKFEVYRTEETVKNSNNNKCTCKCNCKCDCKCSCNCKDKKEDIKKIVKYEYWYQINNGKGKEVKKDDIDKLLKDFAK